MPAVKLLFQATPKAFLALLGAFTMAVALALSATQADAAQKNNRASQSNPRYASIVIDSDNGTVLHARYADKQLHPASLVKMMTLLMAFERIDKGQMSLNDRIKVSAHAAGQPPSKLGLRTGSTITVKDAIYALVTKSANDVAVALGEHIGGSEDRFATMMTNRARELGMTNTVFKNASGLHHAQQLSTARDMARLGRVLIRQHPHHYKYFSTRNFTYQGTSMHNHNRLMESFKGMDGIKTGYINAAGFNLAASATRGDRRLIAVVFGGRTTASRNKHVADLLNQHFDKLGIPENAVRTASAKAITAPLPGRKPDIPGAIRLAANLAANTQTDTEMQFTGTMGEMAGEGDIDPAIAKRFETGMMAIAAIKSEIKPQDRSAQRTVQTATTQHSITQSGANTAQGARLDHVAFNPAHHGQNLLRTGIKNDWAIQVGAFTSRVRSDQALNDAINRLPAALRNNATPVIVPLQAGEGWVFRARIRGLSREQANAACRHFNNCMAISPRAF